MLQAASPDGASETEKGDHTTVRASRGARLPVRLSAVDGFTMGTMTASSEGGAGRSNARDGCV